MKTRLIPILTLLSILISFYQVEAQNTSKATVQKLRNFSRLNAESKLYIHFDKPYYSTTDDIWFKVYLVNAQSHKPVNQSIAFIDLMNSAGEIIQQKQIKITDGGGFGDFSLSGLDVAAGDYIVRGYSNYMRNFDLGNLFYQQIEILGENNLQISDASDDQPNVKMRFFPEGGELIANYNNVLAFEISGDIDVSEVVKGEIIDSKGNTITEFKSEHEGLGAVKIIPAIDESYKAKLSINGIKYQFELPAALPQGYQLKVKNTGRSLIMTANHLDSTKMEGAYLLVHQRGDPFAVISSTGKPYIRNRIELNSFLSGIVTVTLFDNQGLPRRERVVFVENIDEGTHQLKLIADKDVYSAREKISFGLDGIENFNDKINASVSITNLSLVPRDRRTSNLMSYLLLSSDIKGNINNPAYYFDENNSDRLKHLDLLMLTQGWRRFTWDEVLEKEPETLAFKKKSGISLSGSLVDYYKRDKEVQGLVKLTLLNNPIDSKSVLSDADGDFVFENLYLEDTVSVVLQSKRYNQKRELVTNNANIFINVNKNEPINFPLPDLPNKLEKKFQVNEYLEASDNILSIDSAFRLEDGILLLGEFKVQSTKTTTLVDNPFKQAEVLYGEPTKRMVIDSMARVVPSGTIFDLLRSTSGVLIVGSFPNQSIRIRGFSSANSGMSPLVLIDGVQVNIDSSNILNSVFVSDISYIDIIKSPESAIFGSQGANGALAIFTRVGPAGRRRKPKVGIVNLKFPGFSAPREFYTPDYTEKLDKHKQPDYRTTLYWNPNVDFSDRSKVEFFASDEKGIYLIHLEAISSKGEALIKEKIIEVK